MNENLTNEAQDRERAKLAAKVHQMKQEIDDNWPLQLELLAIRARRVFATYNALTKAGFTESQALDLCWKFN